MMTAEVSHHVADLRQQLALGREALFREYLAHPVPSVLLKRHAQLIDRVLRALWRCYPALKGCVSLVAVGGYGRQEQFPYSDVDVLLLSVGVLSPVQVAATEAFIAALWDVGLDVGATVRSIQECLDEAARDITIQTALLDSRFLAGARPLYTQYWQCFLADIDPASFLQAKQFEQAQRYNRFNDTPYSLEPNCKESPGGLRDLQIVHWVIKAVCLKRGISSPLAAGWVSRTEQSAIKRYANRLNKIRCELHLCKRRSEDRLLFDVQSDIANRLFSGASNINVGLPVGTSVMGVGQRQSSECLMQFYYQTAKGVVQLNTIILQHLQEVVSAAHYAQLISLSDDFQVIGGRLDVIDLNLFSQEPAMLLECILLWQQRLDVSHLSARLLRQLWHDRALIDKKFRSSSVCQQKFIQIFKSPQRITDALHLLNQFGLLGRYLPNFRKIVGKMQHDLFHVYTVDQHILQVLSNLEQFCFSEPLLEFALCSQLMRQFERPWILFIAALFHDIAKGRGGDHSELGAVDMQRFCRQHQLTDEDSALAIFLVKHHLTMSNTAQKKDLSDSLTIEKFATIVGSERYLVALYLLTVADIRGTSPKVWNNWKARLLEDCFHRTRAWLSGDRCVEEYGVQSKQTQVLKKLVFIGLNEGQQQALWSKLDTTYFLRHEVDEITWQTRALYRYVHTQEPIVRARTSGIDHGLQVFVYTQDQPDLFARLCAYFALQRLSIIDAKVDTTLHGYALDLFHVQSQDGECDYRALINWIEKGLVTVLLDGGQLAVLPAHRVSRQLKHFPLEPQVKIRSRGERAMLSIIVADRPGLLYQIASVLAAYRVNVHDAKIMTLGARVEDTFTISGRALDDVYSVVAIEQTLCEQLRNM